MTRREPVTGVFPADWCNQLLVGDCLDLLPKLPDMSVPVIITDPPWPDCCISFGDKDPQVVFDAFVLEAARVTPRLIVVLGCDTDPRFLSAVPGSLPFFRLCWLRRVPGSYRGSLFYGADIAYVFGHANLNGTDRVIGGECTAVLQADKDDQNPHPTRRHLHHMAWLVQKFSRPGELILDPFAGSGSTLVAAKMAGRTYCGFEVVPEFATYGELRLYEATSLFEESAPCGDSVRHRDTFPVVRGPRCKRQ